MTAATLDPLSRPQTQVAAVQQLRRLDWRFLLPTPHLGRILFLGRPDSALLDALRVCGHDVASRPGGSPGVLSRAGVQYDVCVTQSAERADLTAAAASLAPGGWLYWELGRRGALSASNARRADRFESGGSRRARRAMQEEGFRAISEWWHYPDFETCQSIIPLDGGAGVSHFLRTRGAPVGTTLAALVTIGRRWMRGFAPAVSFVAQRAPASLEVAQ